MLWRVILAPQFGCEGMLMHPHVTQVPLVLVVMVPMGGMAVLPMQIIHVVAVLDGFVSATLTVLVVPVVLRDLVPSEFLAVVVTLVRMVQFPVMQIIHVVPVWHGGVSAPLAMLVSMILMNFVFHVSP
ncbi:MAG: hypothetical protein Q4A71_07190 [Actinomycetaceae bacterium]|nr:hypothetical protein [Actinomycetaceae bacterium]